MKLRWRNFRELLIIMSKLILKGEDFRWSILKLRRKYDGLCYICDLCYYSSSMKV